MLEIFDSSQARFLLVLTKWRSRLNQWFWPQNLLIDEFDKNDVDVANDLINLFEEALRLTGRSVSQFAHRLRQSTQDSGQRFSLWNLTTHNLLAKNECKISSSQIPHFQKKLPEVRQVWGNIWSKSGDVGNERSLSLRQRFSRVGAEKNCTRKSASPAGVPRGCDRKKNLVKGCVTPPWNDQELSDISFINPLRFASIANATMGLIQAKMRPYRFKF